MEDVKLGRDLDIHKTGWVGGIVWALKSTAKDDVKPVIADLLNDAAKEIEALRSALSSEREACAKVAEEYARQHDEVAAKLRRKPDAELNASKDAAQWIAHLIRERGNQ